MDRKENLVYLGKKVTLVLKVLKVLLGEAMVALGPQDQKVHVVTEAYLVQRV